MSGQDLRKIMNLMESVLEPVEEQQVDEAIEYDTLSRMLWAIFQAGQANDEAEAELIVSEVVQAVMSQNKPVAEETVMETGNGNAQQKGINFNGTKAAKGDGVLPRQAPKAKTSGNSAPLATAKSGTNVGNKKA